MGRSLPLLSVSTGARVAVKAALPFALVGSLGVDAYGAWELCTTLLLVIAPLATLGLREGFIAHAAGTDDAAGRGAQWRAIVWITGGCSVAVALLGFAAAPALGRLVLGARAEYVAALRVSLGMVPPVGLMVIALAYWETRQAFRRYAVWDLVSAAADAAAVIGAVVVGASLLRLLLALFLVRTAVAAVMLRDAWRHDPATPPDFRTVRPFIRYGVPMLLTGLLLWVTKLGDRFILAAFRSLADVGLYALLFNMANLVLLPVLPLQVYAFPALAAAARTDADDVFRTALLGPLGLFQALAIPTACGVALLYPAVLHLLGVETPVTASLHVVMACLLCGSYCYALISVVKYATAVRSTTGRLALINVVGAVANIGANLVLIPRWGLSGAAFATAASMLLLLGLLVLDLRAHGATLQLLSPAQLAAPLAATVVMGGTLAIFRGRVVSWVALAGVVGLGAAVYGAAFFGLSAQARAWVRAYRGAG